MNSTEATVSIVDDDALVLASLARLVRRFGYQVMTYATPRRCLESYDPFVPGCLLLDLVMPGLDGIALFDALCAGRAPPVVVFLSGQADIPSSVAAMKHGAFDFLVKPVDAKELEQALHDAVEHDESARRARDAEQIRLKRLDRLTHRERQVLGHLLRGQLNKQVAWDLGISEKTVKIHRARVMDKMDVHSVVELAGYADFLPRID